MIAKTFVVGDIHGNLRGLLQVLKRAKFDSDFDTLICLGDLTDRMPESAQVLDFLMTLPKFKGVRGNHDDWAIIGYSIQCGITSRKNLTPSEVGAEYYWFQHGGIETVESYQGDYDKMKQHYHFLSKLPYYLEIDSNLFVHGGIDLTKPISKQDKESLNWDRKMFTNAFKGNSKTLEDLSNCQYSRIFIGHTPSIYYNRETPIIIESSSGNKILNLDTGAGYNGRVSMMDLETEEIFQSDSKMYA